MTTEPSGPFPARQEALVSADVGVVHRVDAGVTQYDHPRLAPTFAQVCDTGPLFGVAHPARAGGMAEDPRHSRLAALGEAVERYSAAAVPASRLRSARPVDLAGAPLVEPDWTADPGEPGVIRWVRGSRLRPVGSSEPAWIAASRVYLSDADEPGRVAVPTSTGLACHPDPWRALYSALLEVIERDAVMITWLTRTGGEPLRTSLRWLGDQGNAVRFDRAVEHYELYRLDSPTGVPVVFAVAFGAEQQPGAAVGAAADLDLGRACRKALVEAHQTMHWASHMMTAGRTGSADGALRDLDDHVAHYLDHQYVRAFDFLRRGTRAALDVELGVLPPAVDPEAGCRALVARAEAAGVDCFAVDVTAPEVRSAGLWVIRAVLPGLYPLLVGDNKRPDHPRLRASAPVNPDPHPFP
ncbi:MAG: YcaO-like family protein [Jatrophihabitantaceae bacterium]